MQLRTYRRPSKNSYCRRYPSCRSRLPAPGHHKPAPAVLGWQKAQTLTSQPQLSTQSGLFLDGVLLIFSYPPFLCLKDAIRSSKMQYKLKQDTMASYGCAALFRKVVLGASSCTHLCSTEPATMHPLPAAKSARGFETLNSSQIKYPNNAGVFYLGRAMGLEPTTFGTTTRRSNQLS